MAHARPFSERVIQQQMLYLGKVAQRPSSDPERQCVFEDDTFQLKMATGCRGQGRPRYQWAKSVLECCLQAAGSPVQLADYFKGNAAEWRRVVNQHLGLA